MTTRRSATNNMREVRWFNTALFLIFLTLKLAHVIDWSWWWVFAPFWIPLSITAVALSVVAIIDLTERH